MIEIVSPIDRPSNLRALEADYHSAGIPELVFINLRESRLRHLRRGEHGYQETIITSGPITFDAIPTLTLQAEWILTEPRPNVVDMLTAICRQR